LGFLRKIEKPKIYIELLQNSRPCDDSLGEGGAEGSLLGEELNVQFVCLFRRRL